MIKRLIKYLFIIAFVFCFTMSVEAKSLKQIREQLAKDIANQAELIRKAKETQKRIDSMNAEMSSLNKQITNDENKIKESKEEIENLKVEIENKQEEIDNLLSFLQVAKKDNVYLAYIFEAKDYTDFIYRSAVVEELTKYNDELIDQMYKMIEENKVLQKNLQKKIESSESSIDKLEDLLKKYGLDMNDLDEEKRDVAAVIKARKAELAEYEKTYKENKCKEDVDISKCVKVPPAGQFIRPLKHGCISSLFGMRYHPTLHYWRMHNGIDISGNSVGTKVYAAAAGKVNMIVRPDKPNVANSSCGGNMVYIQHTIKGKQYRTVYMHLHTIKVKVGDIVSATTVIGTVGGTEIYDKCSTGAHLHFGVLKGWEGYTYYDPRNYVNLPTKGNCFNSRW